MAGASSSRGWKRPHNNDLPFVSFTSPQAEEMYNLFMRKGHRMVERNILLADFESVGLYQQFSARGWLGVCSGHDYGLPIMVAEFLANRISVNTDLHTFSSMVRGVRVNFSAEALRLFLDLPDVHNPQYPFIAQVTPTSADMIREVTDGIGDPRIPLLHSHLSPHYRLLNKVVCSFVDPTDHIHGIPTPRVEILFAIGRGYSLDLSLRIWWTVYNYSTHPHGTAAIPYLSILTRILRAHSVPTISEEPRSFTRREISRMSEGASLARIGEVAGAGFEVSIYPPPYPDLIPAFPAIYPPPGYSPPWREAAPAPGDAGAPAAAPIPAPADSMMDFLQMQFASLNSRLDGYDEQFAYSRVRIDRIGRRMQRLEDRLGLEYPSPADTDSDFDDLG